MHRFIYILLLWGTYASAQIPRWVDTIQMKCGIMAFPALIEVPPEREDMSADVKFAYRYLDSLARHNSQETADSLVRNTTNPTILKALFKYLYTLTDYDAALYREFGITGYDLDTMYKSGPLGPWGDFWVPRIKKKGIGTESDLLLLGAEVILHIKVNEIYEDTAFAHGSPRYISRCVFAEILDTLKGKHLASRNTSGKGETIFTYLPRTVKFDTEEDMNLDEGIIDIYTPGFNSLRIDSTSMIHNSLYKKSQEYIVFLTSIYYGYDGANAYYMYFPFPRNSVPGGAFAIDDQGNVLDKNNTFGMGTSVPVEVFKAGVRKEITGILNPK